MYLDISAANAEVTLPDIPITTTTSSGATVQVATINPNNAKVLVEANWTDPITTNGPTSISLPMPTSKLNFTVNVPSLSLPFIVGNIYVGSAFNNLVSTPISPSEFTYTSSTYTQTIQANKYYGIISILVDTPAYYIRYEYFASPTSSSYVVNGGRWYKVVTLNALPEGMSVLSHCLFMSNETTPRLLCGVYDGSYTGSNASFDAIIPRTLVDIPAINPN